MADAEAHFGPGTTWGDLKMKRRMAYLALPLLLYRPKRVLDIGCGPGLTRFYARYASEAFAVDLVPSLLRETAKTGEVQGVLADVEAGIPFRDGAFDAIVSTEVFEHLRDPGNLFREASRLLCVGGIFIMTTPNTRGLTLWALLHLLPRSLARRLASKGEYRGHGIEVLHPALFDLSHLDNSVDHHRREGATIDEIVAMGTEHGFVFLWGRTWNLPLSTQLWDRLPLALRRLAVHRLQDAMRIGLPQILVVLEKID